MFHCESAILDSVAPLSSCIAVGGAALVPKVDSLGKSKLVSGWGNVGKVLLFSELITLRRLCGVLMNRRVVRFSDAFFWLFPIRTSFGFPRFLRSRLTPGGKWRHWRSIWHFRVIIIWLSFEIKLGFCLAIFPIIGLLFKEGSLVPQEFVFLFYQNVPIELFQVCIKVTVQLGKGCVCFKRYQLCIKGFKFPINLFNNSSVLLLNMLIGYFPKPVWMMVLFAPWLEKFGFVIQTDWCYFSCSVRMNGYASDSMTSFPKVF